MDSDATRMIHITLDEPALLGDSRVELLAESRWIYLIVIVIAPFGLNAESNGRSAAT